MPSLITVLGSCLVAAGTMYPWSWSAAIAADLPANPASEPWRYNPPTAASPVSGLKITESPPTTAAGPGFQVAQLALPCRAGLVADSAPDPPGLRTPVRPTALSPQDFAPAAEMPAGSTSAEKTKPIELAQPDTVQSLPPPLQLPATVPERMSTTPEVDPSPSTTPQGSATPLGLGGRNGKTAPGKSSPLGAMFTAGGSLAIVLGLFLFVAWAMRKAAPRGSLLLPKEVFEVLGRAPLGARQQVQLLRCGNKLLLVSITPGGAETLTEVTDPVEVDRIAGICQQTHPKSATKAFRQVFQQLVPNSDAPSELDDLPPAGTRRKRYRWEENHA